MRKLLFALTLTLASLGLTVTPVSADHDTHAEQCYYVDVYMGTSEEYVGDGWWYRTNYYDVYYECTDGHWYWSWYQYSYQQHRWVQTA